MMSVQDSKPKAVEVRTATGDDLAAVISVGHRTWPPTFEPIAGPDYVAMGLAKWWTHDAVTASIRTGRTLVASQGGEVVGLATHGVQDDQVVLWKLYVLPGHHGEGIGTALLHEVETRVVASGHDQLLLSHIAGNDQAAAFYFRHGFVTTHLEQGGSGMPDSVWMSKSLSGPAGRPRDEEGQ